MSGFLPIGPPRRRARFPASWSPYLRRRSRLAAEIRIMIWAGLLAGLLAFQALRWWTPPPPALEAPPGSSNPAADPWLRSRPPAETSRVQEGRLVPPPAPAPSAGERIDPASVRVVDGDTFDLAGTRIRIADIDTPETFSPRCRSEAELGARATRRLRALLAQGPFELAPVGRRDEDRYGRKLRIVLRDGRSVGDRLVAGGLARAYGGGRRAGWCA